MKATNFVINRRINSNFVQAADRAADKVNIRLTTEQTASGGLSYKRTNDTAKTGDGHR